MKNYQVFYIIKANGTQQVNHMFVMAKNKAEAQKKVKALVKERTGRNAFHPTAYGEGDEVDPKDQCKLGKHHI